MKKAAIKTMVLNEDRLTGVITTNEFIITVDTILGIVSSDNGNLEVIISNDGWHITIPSEYASKFMTKYFEYFIVVNACI